MMDIFYYLRHGLSLVLIFVGLKMLLMGYLQIPIGIALGVVGAVLLIAIIASVNRSKRIKKKNLLPL